ncbi:MAG: zinc-binding dehydrogenase [Actinomycetota bacterium]|nr:zinc-binding dehydrogenase [Actinomycetota bacterium]
MRFLDGQDAVSFAWRHAERQRLVDAAAAGTLTVPIARALPLRSAAEAIAISKAGHPSGKLALTVESS